MEETVCGKLLSALNNAKRSVTSEASACLSRGQKTTKTTLTLERAGGEMTPCGVSAIAPAHAFPSVVKTHNSAACSSAGIDWMGSSKQRDTSRRIAGFGILPALAREETASSIIPRFLTYGGMVIMHSRLNTDVSSTE